MTNRNSPSRPCKFEDLNQTHRIHSNSSVKKIVTDSQNKVGYFLFSLDTELAWGYYDMDHRRNSLFSQDGVRERRSITTLLNTMDEYGIHGTWALVGHLFYAKCEECEACPVLDWQGKYQSYDEIYGTNAPLWYGADLVDTLRSRGPNHEIAFHGYTHRSFEESRMKKEEAHFEVEEWLRLAERVNIKPKSVVFPRNKVGHLDVFAENGFTSYRGEKVMPRTYSIPILGKILNNIDLKLQVFVPQVYELGITRTGLMNLPSSQWFFRIDRRIERVLDRLNLQTLRIKSITKAVERAAEEKKIVHIWAHPFEFRTEKDFEKLRYLFQFVARLAEKGKIQSVTMSELATISTKFGLHEMRS